MKNKIFTTDGTDRECVNIVILISYIREIRVIRG